MRTVLWNKAFIIFFRRQSSALLFKTCLFSDTTPYSANKTKDMVLKEVQYFSLILTTWK